MAAYSDNRIITIKDLLDSFAQFSDETLYLKIQSGRYVADDTTSRRCPTYTEVKHSDKLAVLFTDTNTYEQLTITFSGKANALPKLTIPAYHVLGNGTMVKYSNNMLVFGADIGTVYKDKKIVVKTIGFRLPSSNYIHFSGDYNDPDFSIQYVSLTFANESSEYIYKLTGGHSVRMYIDSIGNTYEYNGFTISVMGGDYGGSFFFGTAYGTSSVPSTGVVFTIQTSKKKLGQVSISTDSKVRVLNGSSIIVDYGRMTAIYTCTYDNPTEWLFSVYADGDKVSKMNISVQNATSNIQRDYSVAGYGPVTVGTTGTYTVTGGGTSYNLSVQTEAKVMIRNSTLIINGINTQADSTNYKIYWRQQHNEYISGSYHGNQIEFSFQPYETEISQGKLEFYLEISTQAEVVFNTLVDVRFGESTSTALILYPTLVNGKYRVDLIFSKTTSALKSGVTLYIWFTTKPQAAISPIWKYLYTESNIIKPEDGLYIVDMNNSDALVSGFGESVHYGYKTIESKKGEISFGVKTNHDTSVLKYCISGVVDYTGTGTVSHNHIEMRCLDTSVLTQNSYINIKTPSNVVLASDVNSNYSCTLSVIPMYMSKSVSVEWDENTNSIPQFVKLNSQAVLIVGETESATISSIGLTYSAIDLVSTTNSQHHLVNFSNITSGYYYRFGLNFTGAVDGEFANVSADFKVTYTNGSTNTYTYSYDIAAVLSSTSKILYITEPFVLSADSLLMNRVKSVEIVISYDIYKKYTMYIKDDYYNKVTKIEELRLSGDPATNETTFTTVNTGYSTSEVQRETLSGPNPGMRYRISRNNSTPNSSKYTIDYVVDFYEGSIKKDNIKSGTIDLNQTSITFDLQHYSQMNRNVFEWASTLHRRVVMTLNSTRDDLYANVIIRINRTVQQLKDVGLTDWVILDDGSGAAMWNVLTTSQSTTIGNYIVKKLDLGAMYAEYSKNTSYRWEFDHALSSTNNLSSSFESMTFKLGVTDDNLTGVTWPTYVYYYEDIFGNDARFLGGQYDVWYYMQNSLPVDPPDTAPFTTIQAITGFIIDITLEDLTMDMSEVVVTAQHQFTVPRLYSEKFSYMVGTNELDREVLGENLVPALGANYLIELSVRDNAGNPVTEAVPCGINTIGEMTTPSTSWTSDNYYTTYFSLDIAVDDIWSDYAISLAEINSYTTPSGIELRNALNEVGLKSNTTHIIILTMHKAFSNVWNNTAGTYEGGFPHDPNNRLGTGHILPNLVSVYHPISWILKNLDVKLHNIREYYICSPTELDLSTQYSNGYAMNYFDYIYDRNTDTEYYGYIFYVRSYLMKGKSNGIIDTEFDTLAGHPYSSSSSASSYTHPRVDADIFIYRDTGNWGWEDNPYWNYFNIDIKRVGTMNRVLITYANEPNSDNLHTKGIVFMLNAMKKQMGDYVIAIDMDGVIETINVPCMKPIEFYYRLETTASASYIFNNYINGWRYAIEDLSSPTTFVGTSIDIPNTMCILSTASALIDHGGLVTFREKLNRTDFGGRALDNGTSYNATETYTIHFPNVMYNAGEGTQWKANEIPIVYRNGSSVQNIGPLIWDWMYTLNYSGHVSYKLIRRKYSVNGSTWEKVCNITFRKPVRTYIFFVGSDLLTNYTWTLESEWSLYSRDPRANYKSPEIAS